MKSLAKIANVLLLLVGFQYVLIGILAIFGAGLLESLLAEYTLVAPLQLIHKSIDLYCGPGGFFCEIGPENEVMRSRQIEVVLGILAVVGGIISTLGAIDLFRNKKFGYRIWIFFVILSFAVAIWNIVWRADMYSFISISWAILYLSAYLVVKKTFYKSAV